MTAGNNASDLAGLFDVVSDFQDFIGGLNNFTDLVQEGETRLASASLYVSAMV
jgi:hypothetical protein